jgi:hypothetical protein
LRPYRHPFPGAFFILIFLPAIILMQSPAAYPFDSHNLGGQIIDSETGHPVAGAEIRLAGRSELVLSDNNGYFIIPRLPAGDFTLHITADAYERFSTEVSIVDGPDLELGIRLKPLVFDMPGLLVNGKRYNRRMGDASRIGSVEITPAEAVQFDHVGEIARRLPGVFIRDEGPGGAKTISINGCDPDRVNVVFDGILLNPGSGKAVDLREIPIASIAKIEIYSGRGATGGIMVLVPRCPFGSVKDVGNSGVTGETNGDNYFVDGAVESYGTNDFKTGAELRTTNIGLNCYFENFYTAGDFEYTDKYGKEVKRINNKREYGNCFAKINLPSLRNTEVSFQYYSARKGSPGPLLQIDSTAVIKTKKCTGRIGHIIPVGGVRSLKINISGMILKDRFSSTGGFFRQDVESRESRYTASISLDNAYVRLGIGNFDYKLSSEFSYEDFRSDDLRGGAGDIGLKARRKAEFEGDLSKNIRILSKLSPLELMAGIGGKVNLTSGYHPHYDHHWSIESSVINYFTITAGLFGGGSFRLPDYYSLFFKEDIYAVGDPDLKPERGHSVGWRINVSRSGAMYLSAEYACTRNTIDDIIVWKQRFDGKYAPDNVDRAELTTSSFNVTIGSHDDPVTVRFQHNRYRPINKSDFRLHRDKYLLFRPLYTADLVMEFGTKVTRLLVELRAVGKRYIRPENTLYLDPYMVTDVRITHKFSINKLKCSLRAGIENLGDEEYQIIERYPSPGRTFTFGFNISI